MKTGKHKPPRLQWQWQNTDWAHCPRPGQSSFSEATTEQHDRAGMRCFSQRNGDRWGFSHCLIRSVLIRWSSNGDIYLSAQKSMTLWFFVHSITKRAEAIALVNSGATENFMNLMYAKWLQLPIKQMNEPRKLLNVDRTENKSRELRYYTNL